VAGHGWLQILQLDFVSLMLAGNLVLEIVAIHPDSVRILRRPMERTGRASPPKGVGHGPDFME
jgi:hypothetical protein